MPFKRVVNFSQGYSLTDKKFLFYYTLEDEENTTQILVTPEESLALADIFKSGSPISFNTDAAYFVSGAITLPS
jgi:hypothetical protein